VDLTIRDARFEDSAKIAGLLDQLGYPTDESAVPPRLERLRVVGDRVVVADVDGVVAGLAHLQVTPALERERPAAKIAALVVDEAHRGRGVGAALVAEMELEARRRGCELLFLTTAARRADAHTFYERIGLEETGKRFAKTLTD
jgi:GNAT superfamily N-acetyltransferase